MKDGLKALNKITSYKQTLFNSLFTTEDFLLCLCQMLRGFPSTLQVTPAHVFIDLENTTTSYCSAVVIHLKPRSHKPVEPE